MPDFLTDDDIEKAEGLSDDDIDRMSNAFNDSMRQAAQKTVGGVGAVAGAIGKGLQYVDAYSPLGAPLRAGIGATQEGGGFLEAYKRQYGEDPSKAPTGSQIAARAGVPTQDILTIKEASPFTGPAIKASLADVAGTVGEAALDPTSYIGGGAGKVVGEAIGKGAAKVSPKVAAYLAKLAEERAAKAATGQSVAGLRRMAKVTPKGATDAEAAASRLRATGRALLEKDAAGEAVIRPFGSVEDVAERAGAKTKYFGESIGEIGSRLDEIKPNAVSGKSIADDILEYAAKIPPTEKGKALQERLLREADNFQVRGDMSFTEAQKWKNQFKFEPQQADALVSDKDTVNELNRIIAKRMDKAIEEHGSPQMLAEYMNAKSKYGMMKTAAETASARGVQNLANRIISPSSHGIGGAVLAGELASGAPGAGAAAKSALAGVANQFALTRGNTAAAVLLDQISKKLAAAGASADKYAKAFGAAGLASAEAFLLRHKLLMQTDSGYRAIITGNSQENQQ